MPKHKVASTSKSAGPLLRSLAEHVGTVVAELPEHARTPTSMARTLGLRPPLCHRLIAGARAHDTATIAATLPGPEGLGMFIAAATAAGVSSAAIDALAQAAEAYQSLLKSAGISRASLIRDLDRTTVRAAGGDDQALEDRARASDAMARVLGCRGLAMTSITIIEPVEPGSNLHRMLRVSGRLGLQRLDARRHLHFRDFLRVEQPERSEPDCQDRDRELRDGLRRRYSTFPLPVFDRAESPAHPSASRVATIDPEQATMGPIDVYNGPFRSPPRDCSPGTVPSVLNLWVACTVPVRWLVNDVFVPRDLARRCEVSCAVLEASGREVPCVPLERLEHEWVPDDTLVSLLGSGLSRVPCRGAPSHAEVAQFIFETERLDPDAFVGYRLLSLHPIPLLPYVLSIKIE